MTEAASRPSDNRSLRLERLRQLQRVPVLIVGGGINGISTFRELALQGIPVVMIEKGDWCQGASGALSRMIHGGLRYLETGEFGLVRESVEERDRLLKNAPHYVAPLRTTVPLDSWGGGIINAGKRFFRLSETPSRRGALLVKTGLSLYDAYTRRYGSMPKHQLYNQQQTRQRWPELADWVRCSATYYDAQIAAPERLGYELIEDSERANADALAINYMQLEESDGERLTLRDSLSGETFSLQPHVVVNASGAWIDQLNATLASGDRTLIGGTKGSHLIVRCPELLQALNGDMIYFENAEGRVCIMFPWYGNVLIGSTDIRVDDPETVVCEADEKQYILDALRFVFPRISVKDENVLYTFCGVRPLPASEAAISGRISRNHSLVIIAPDARRDFTTLCLVGGKWTTFRKFGEQAADKVLNLLGERRKVSTGDLPIGGGHNYPSEQRKASWQKQLSQQYQLSPARVSRLVSRYGTRAQQMMKFIIQAPDHPLHHQPDWTQRELIWLMRHEQVCLPDDLVIRRTPLAMSGLLTRPLLEEIVDIMAVESGWSAAEKQQQLTQTLHRLAHQHGLASLLSATPDRMPARANPAPPAD